MVRPSKDEQQVRKELAIWKSRALRRGKMLQLVATFLRSCNMRSDVLKLKHNCPRGEDAELQYIFAAEFAQSAEKETKNDGSSYTKREERRDADRKIRLGARGPGAGNAPESGGELNGRDPTGKRPALDNALASRDGLYSSKPTNGDPREMDNETERH